ncbi:MAG: addiction module antitoxin, RelB/DinJ family [Massilibacillus sp.]|jgi:DNA-damage-inducible protein J|nr:addiction module antitoxin, RelB/DinJ family [Massilibacillus sp.]
MAQTTITIRIDENLKKQAEKLFDEMGMNMTTAYTIFTKAVVMQGKIPFEITANIPNAKTIEAMQEGDDLIKSGKSRFNNADEMFHDLGI